MEITLMFGSSKEQITIEEGITVGDLMKHFEEITQVPQYNQKIIFKGNNIAKDPEKCLGDVGIKSKSRIMVIGQKHNPEEEKLLKHLEDTNKRIEQNAKYYREILTDIDSMKKGFLEESFVPQFIAKVKKNLLRCTEDGMKAIESLDCMAIDEKFADARHQKKRLIKRTQKLLDDLDKTADELAISSIK